jgi:transcriptional regulator with XRE-family HTH domain
MLLNMVTRPHSQTNLGSHLKMLRKAAGLTQWELANALGENQSTIAYWEAGDRPPRSQVLPAMAQALGVSVEVLLGQAGSKPMATKRPSGKLGAIFETVSKLPRRQQERFVLVANIFIEQERKRAE